MTAAKYNQDSIKVLEGLEAVRQRPSMYIGNIGIGGLHHLVYEVVDNSMDEALAGYCTQIQVKIHPDNSISVLDNGRGIPTGQHQSGLPALEVVLTKLHAGGKFDNDAYKTSGGLHGVGISVVNALSSKLVVEVHTGTSVCSQSFSKGNKLGEMTTKKTTKEPTGTFVHFWPDPEIFKETEYNYDTLLARFRELTFLNPGVRIEMEDLRTDPPTKVDLLAENGLSDFITWANKGQGIHQPIRLTTTKDEVYIDVVIQYNTSYAEKVYSFVNNINTIEGGSHLSGFKAALTKAVNQYATDNLPKNLQNTKISGEDVREGLTAIVSLRIKNPQFEGQTKTKLGNSDIHGIVSSLVLERLNAFFEENPGEAKKIMMKSVEAAKGREAAKRARDLSRSKSQFNGNDVATLPGKLADCQSNDPRERELFLCEGDSASGCWAGDTKIALVDGRNISFLEMIKEQGQGIRHFGYTTTTQGEIKVGELVNARMTGIKDTLVLTLDNGEELECTENQEFLLVNKTYLPAKDLTTSHSIMPLYRRITKMDRKAKWLSGYEQVRNRNRSSWEYTHHLADRYNIENGVYEDLVGMQKHHVDFNKLNNNPINIIRVTCAEHLDLHREDAKVVWKEFYNTNEEYRIANLERLDKEQKRYWSDPENVEKQSGYRKEYFRQHPEAKKVLSDMAKKQWENQELKAWRAKTTSKQWTPEFRAKRKRAMDQTYYNKTLAALKKFYHHNILFIRDFEKYRKAKKDHIILSYMTFAKRYYGTPYCSKITEDLRNYNHKIVKIEPGRKGIPVYDLEVPGTHNYALAAGVFVHNSAKQGRDRRFQAILPLKGKILNVERARLSKILQNEEIGNIITALGTGIGEDEFDPTKCKYHKIIIMADADVDGSHIRTLLMTFFYRQMPELIMNGYLYIAQPPLFKIGKGSGERYLKNEEEYEAWVMERGCSLVKIKVGNSILTGQDLLEYLNSDKVHKCEMTKEELLGHIKIQGRSGIPVQRYKGLGEMNPEQLWETTMDPKNRTLVRVVLEDAAYTDELFSILMGEEVEPRRDFIYEHALNVTRLDI